MSSESKLVELRRKTDRDLLILVQRELDRGLTLAGVAATKESPLYEQGEKAYRKVKVLLPRISGLDRDQYREFESKLKELRGALDGLESEKMLRHFAVTSSE
jgi:hypothetical protein